MNTASNIIPYQQRRNELIDDLLQEAIIENILDAWEQEDIVLLNRHIFELAKLRKEDPKLVSREVFNGIFKLCEGEKE